MTAYVIAQTTVTDQEKYQKEFIPATLRSHEVHNVEILVRTNAVEALSGGQAPERMVVLKFRDLAHARHGIKVLSSKRRYRSPRNARPA
jgi:uncharacterized protein (DUF1330 family)